MAEITSLSLTVGAAQHVTVVDHNNSDAPLPPTSVTWVALGALPISIITIDATGFNFLANSPGSGSFQASWHNGAISVTGPPLGVTAVSAVQPAYISP